MNADKFKEITIKLRSRNMLSEGQVAELFEIPRSTLRCWRWQGKGPKYYKAGRTVKYRAEDIDAYLVGQPVETLDSMKMEQER